MSGQRQSRLVDWGFRLLIVAAAILWLIFPPRGAEATGEAPAAIERVR